MRNILRQAKRVAVVLVRELIPAPTIARLQKLRMFARNPVKIGGRKLGATASHRLSPKNYFRLRSFYFKHIKGGIADPLLTRNAALGSKAPKPIVVKIDNLVHQGRTYAGIPEFLAENDQLKCDIVVCCAFYGRYDILDLVVEEGTAETEGANVLYCLVGSTDDDRDFLESVTRRNPHVFGLIAENHPVGRKWQTSVQAAYQMCDFELLGITGSDDILTSKLLGSVLARHRENISNSGAGYLLPALYATMEWLIFAKGAKQKYTPQMVRCNYKLGSAVMPIGGGRFYSQPFVEKVGGILFDVKRDKLLDDMGFELVNQMGMGVEYYDVTEGSVFNVKGDWIQMNEFDAIASATTVDVHEYSFKGYSLLREQLSPAVFDKTFDHSSYDQS